MGFSMIEVIRKVRNEINFHSLDMRIGMKEIVSYSFNAIIIKTKM